MNILKQGTIIVESLEAAKKAALEFLEKCEKGGILNSYTNTEDDVVGYKAIPKTRKFINGSDIDQIFIYRIKQ